MAVRNPFDQIILDDPAYAEETKIDPQAGKKLVRDIYGLVLGEEDPFAKEKLERELSIALAQKEAGLPVDPNKSFVTSAERQDPVLGPALDKFKFEPMGLGEFGERALEFLYRDQEKARSKQLRGEELTLGEKIAANPFMAALDAADFTGLLALATRGGIKLSVKGLQTLNNLRSQGASKEVINQVMTSQFPDDAQKIGLVYYQSNRPPGMETSQIMKAADDGGAGGSSTYQKLTEEGKYNPTSAFGEKMQKDIEKKNKKFQLLEEYYTNNPADKTESAVKVRQNLKNLLPEGETLIKDVDIQQYARDNPNTALGKAVKPPKVPRAEQLTEDKFNLLQQEFNETGEKLNLLQASELVNIPYNTFRRLSMENEELAKLVAPKPIVGRADTLFHSYFPTKGKNSSLEKQAQYTIIRDMYRANGLGNNTKEFEAFMKELGFVPNKLKTIVDGKVEYKINPDYNLDDMTERRQRFFDEVIKPTFFKEPGSYEEYLNKLTHRNELTDYSIKKFIETVKNNPSFQEQFVKEYRKKYKDSDILDDVEAMAYDFAAKNFNAQMAHVMPIDLTKAKTPKGEGTFKLAPNLEGMMFQSPFINVNYAAHNIGTQRKFENIIRKSLSQIKNGKNVDQNLNKLIEVNNAMTERGLQTYLRFTDKQMPEKAFKLLQAKLGNKVQVEPEVAGVKSIFLGDRGFSLEENIKFFDDRMQNYIDNPQDFKISNKLPKMDPDKVDEMFIKGSAPYIGEGKPTNFKKGGPVKMAIGGDPLTNINQQQFADDPAFQGQDFFKEAVESGNLQAFNPVNIFKGLGKVKAMLTPNKVTDVPTMPKATDPIEDFTVPPPMKPKVNPGDFPFQSYLLGAITDPNAPKNAAPNEWMNFLAKGKNVSESELNDSGISAYLEDSIKFLPGQKVSQETLVDVFEKSPIANIEIFVKKSDVPDRPDTDRDVVNFNSLQGRPEHKGAGNVRIDEAGENYREILINAPELPGQKEPYFNTSHYSKEPNILAFARVADYKNVQGDDVAVIQELQTDYLTKLKKEQERLGALVQNIENKKRFLQEKLMQDPTDAYYGDQLRALETQYPNARVEFLKNTNLTKPSKPLILETMAPDIQSNLAELQTKIQAIANQNKFQVVDPNYQNKIVDLQVQGREQFNKLFELNRQQNFDDQLKDVFVTSESQSDDILRSAQDRDLPAQYRGKKLETFPSIPFNKGPDWIDMMLKATIQDARSNGINKIAIMPAEFVNMRWNKDPSGPAAEKFKTIYDKIAVQQMKNIAKKYGGNVEIEQVIDKTKGKFGYKYINKGAGGEEILDTTDDLDKTVIKPKDYFDARIMKELKTYGDNSILLRREIAPNQFSEFIVRPDDERTTIGYKLETPPDGFNEDNIIRIIQEYNPSETPMFVLTLPEETSKQGPMFLFRKKDGGKIASDGLVSITDIYGEYNGRKV